MAALPSDAIVFFGATGDLAYKQIFPSLAGAGARRRTERADHRRREGRLEPRSAEGARSRQPASNTAAPDPAAQQRLIGLLRYVDGDYSDPSTFAELRKQLGEAQRPLHYLAVPPSLFATVAEGAGEVRLRRTTRAWWSKSRSATTAKRRAR